MRRGCRGLGRDGEFVIIIDEIRKFIAEECPLIKGKRTLKLNCLEENAPAMTIEQVPGNPIIKRYTDGGSQRQAIFVIASREEYDVQLWKQVQAANFYENLQAWMEKVSRAKQLPKLGDGLTAQRMEVTSCGYMFSNNEHTARYQVQCKVIYYKEGR
ncbi:MAG: hypothetical protein IJC78_01980 [Clostridia bacterium]|nr:hypothetical protein [Clostridia bacterium]